jgi:hypothetical protein
MGNVLIDLGGVGYGAPMSFRNAGYLLLAVTAGACGKVADDQPDAAVKVDATPVGSTLYRGTLAATAAVEFGGGGFCKYTMTLKQIEVEVAISTTGQITAASTTNLTGEATVPPCDFAPDGPHIQKFALKSATPVGSATMLVMQGAADNTPQASLAITLTPGGGAFTAAARWTRTDQQPPLNWTVTASLTLTLRP